MGNFHDDVVVRGDVWQPRRSLSTQKLPKESIINSVVAAGYPAIFSRRSLCPVKSFSGVEMPPTFGWDNFEDIAIDWPTNIRTPIHSPSASPTAQVDHNSPVFPATPRLQ